MVKQNTWQSLKQSFVFFIVIICRDFSYVHKHLYHLNFYNHFQRSLQREGRIISIHQWFLVVLLLFALMILKKQVKIRV